MSTNNTAKRQSDDNLDVSRSLEAASPSGVPKHSLEADIARLLVRESAVAEALHVVMAVILAAITWGQIPLAQVGAWLLAMVVATGYRTMTRRILASTSANAETVIGSLRLAVATAGVVWGVGGLLFGGYLDFNQFMLVAIIYAGMAAAGTSTLVADRSSFYAFIIPQLGLFIAGTLLNGLTTLHWTAVGLVIFYGITLHVIVNRGNRTLEDSLVAAAVANAREHEADTRRAFLDALLSAAPNAVAALDSGGSVILTNPAFESLFGYSGDEVMGRDLNEIIVPENMRGEADHLDTLLRRGSTVVEDLQRQRKSGEVIWVRASAAYVERQGVLFVMYEDITEMKQTQAALEHAEEQYRELIQTASDLVWEVDAAGRWVFLNAAAEQIYGMPISELIGTSFDERSHEDVRERDLQTFRDVMAGKSLVDYETKHVAKDGRTKTLSFSATPVRDESGGIEGVRGTARDVTERVETRLALEEARAAAERAVAAKAAFLANMSHEIRTPMNGVLGMAELLMDSELNAEQLRMTELIRSSAESLLTIIDDILDFSKIEAGSIELEETSFDLPYVMYSIVRLFGVRAFERGVEVVADVKPDVPQFVLADPTRLRQVVNNLVSNAVKFTHDGEIVVSVRLLERTDHECRLRVGVRDTGIGIPDDRLDSIFDEFSQADASMTRRYGGTGLGLAICKKLVSLMGGELHVTSEEGKGSEFFFELEVGIDERPPAMPESVDLQNMRGKQVMVVDDNPTNCRIVRDMLNSYGVVVEQLTDPAGTFERLVERLEEQPVDLILTDAHMPELDGFQLSEKVRNDERFEDVKIMMLTSGGRRGDAKRCRELGITGYLTKPVERSELLEAAAGVIAGSNILEASGGLITRHSIAEGRKSLKVLLAEDNPVNQEVAAMMLRKRGHDVDIVADGNQAVEAVRKKDYDLVLMDVQMPEMDGLAATKEIRGIPALRELPIFALTAHVLKEEKARCLEIGMNDVISKPFKPHELFGIIEGWTEDEAELDEEAEEVGVEAAVGDGDGEGPDPVLLDDLRSTLSEAGIEDAMDQLLQVYFNDAPGRMENIEYAVKSGAMDEVKSTAHAYKSASGSVAAKNLHGLLERLEAAGRDRDTDQAKKLVAQVRQEHNRVVAFLSKHVDPS